MPLGLLRSTALCLGELDQPATFGLLRRPPLPYRLLLGEALGLTELGQPETFRLGGLRGLECREFGSEPLEFLALGTLLGGLVAHPGA